ncbi:hypothetical protein B5X24_HaOG215034 [Helicoverpa armigera]|nr:hypothetical protein B5X24_HaOG215034 [Helicoverpa armigera]
MSKNLRALDTLGQPTDKWDALVIFIIASKLDPVTYTKWEEYRATLTDYHKLESFTMFLRNRADILETMHFANTVHTDKGHFLVGRPLTAVPSPPITALRPNRYELIEKIRQQFWSRWQKEFLAEMQQRSRWRTQQQGLNCGDLVLLREANLPPLQWRLGRVTRLHPGPDGVSRVADVTTTKGTYELV